MPSDTDNKIAVFIDSENIPADFSEAIFTELKKLGEVGFCRAFGDFDEQRLEKWNAEIERLPMTKFQQTQISEFKNAADMALIIGAMDLLHWGRAKRFCIVTDDGDFTPLAKRLIAGKCEVIGIGTSNASKNFTEICDRFIQLSPISSSKNVKTRKLPPSKAIPLIKKAIRNNNLGGEWATLGALRKAVKELDTNFDPTNYQNCTGLKNLLEKTQHFTIDSKTTPTRVSVKPQFRAQ